MCADPVAQPREGKSALLKLQSGIMLAVDEGLLVVLVVLDLSATFETIDHSIWLHRLESRFGASGSALASQQAHQHQFDVENK